MFLTPVVLAIVAAIQSPAPRHKHPLSRLMIAYLHFRQPISRGWARYSVRLKAKVMKHDLGGYQRPGRLPVDPLDADVLRYWSKEHDRLHMLDQIKREVKAAGWRKRVDSGWGAWDMEIYGSRYVKVRITTATEHHHGVGMLTQVRVRALMSKFCAVLFGATLMMAGLLLIYLWPFSRTAALIPLMWWTMFLVNRWHVTNPVVALVDQVAERSGFYPVYAPTKAERKANRRAMFASDSKEATAEMIRDPLGNRRRQQEDDIDLEDHQPLLG
jgi:hypothetical protein